MTGLDRLIAIAACGVILFGVASCGGDGAAGPASEDAGPASEDAARPAFVDYGRVVATVPAQDLAALREDRETSEEVYEVLGDGGITFAEYESSVLAALECSRAVGAHQRPGDPRLSSRGVYSWSNRIPGGERAAQTIDAVQRCYTRHLGVVELYWKQAVAPSETEVRQAMDEMATCMRGRGLDQWIPTDSQPHQFQASAQSMEPALRAVYLECARDIQATWGLIGFVSEPD